MAEPASPSVFDRMPLWAQVVSVVGFPIMVASFYMAKDVGILPSVDEANAKAIQEIIQQHRNMPETLRAICHNTAKTLAEAKECP